MGDTRFQPVVLLDLDGTLVDSVYGHVIAWADAFHVHGYDVSMWRIHAAIGMGGSRLVPWVLGRHVPDAEDIVEDHRQRFLDRAGALRPTRGAAALLDDLDRRKIPYEIATSAEAEVRKALLDVLGRDDLPSVDADDVGASKPAPDLLLATCADLGAAPRAATLVGDSPWDAEAASRVGIRTIGLRCGGFSDDALLRAGAQAVVDDPGALVARL